MIVPGFIVNRFYQKGSLRREPGGVAISFRPTLGAGTAALTGPRTVAIRSGLSDLDLTALPDLYLNGQLVPVADLRLTIDGQDPPGYVEGDAGPVLAFSPETEFCVHIRRDLEDGRHDFKIVARSTQFQELIVHLRDVLGTPAPVSWWNRLLGWLRGRPAGIDNQEESPVRESAFYILKDRRPDPDFGRVLTTFARKEPDRVPLLELYADAEVKAAFLGRPVTGMRDEVEFHLAAGYDCVPIMLPFVGPRSMTVIDSHRTTYKGGLQERAWVAERDGVITTMEDFDRFQWPEIADAYFGDFEEVRRHLPPEMKVVGTMNCIFEQVSEAMGLETFSLNLYDQPDLVRAMFDRLGGLGTRCIERMMQFDCVGAIWLTDDLCHKGGPIISPRMLREFVFPWYRKYVAMVHARGLPILFHSCGNTEPLFEDLVGLGFDALHPLEANSVDIYRAKKTIGDRICLVGNLDLSYMLTRATPDEVVEDVKKHVRELGPGGGYCLGSSNSIPNYVPLENFIAMNRACLEHGRYPISA
jgi:uroporphyrinogen decarboxylase